MDLGWAHPDYGAIDETNSLSSIRRSILEHEGIDWTPVAK